MPPSEVRLYALSTCMWCKKTKALLDELGIAYECVFVNELHGEDRERALQEIDKHNPTRSFPTLVAGGAVVVGFKPDEIRKAVGK